VGLSAYVRAVAVRWVWLLVAGLVGLVSGGLLSALTPPAYAAQASLYVAAARVDGDDGAAWATLIKDEVVPSVAALARSGVVLDRVVARLDLPVGAGELADRVTVAVAAETNLLDVTVTDSDPARAARTADAVADVVTTQSARLLTGPSGPLLRLSLVRPAAVPRFADGPGTLTTGVAGAAGGAGLATLLAGLAELARPRIRGHRDVAEVSTAPVLAVLPPATHPRHAERLAPLRAQLDAAFARVRRGPAVLLPASPGGRAAAGAWQLAARLAALPAGRAADPGTLPVAAADPRFLDRAGTCGVVLLADGQGTTRAQLAATEAAVRAAGLPVLGVVVDGVLPPRASWRARLRAGIRGDAEEWVEERIPDRSAVSGASTPTRTVAGLAVAALGFPRPLPLALTTGLLATVALLPVWAPVVRRYRGATLLMAATGLALASGVLLTWLSSRDHDFARYEAVSTGVVVLTLATGTGLILWARTVLPLPVLGAAYGLGALAAGVLAMPGSENPVKFQLSFPLTVIVLSLLAGRRRPVVTVAALLALGLLNVLSDARSAFAFTVVAAALMLWQSRRGRRSGRLGVQVAVLGTLAACGYWVLRELLLAGVLGAALQERTATQIAQTGSLLLGGRPEWTATWALMRDTPLGFGLGTVPTAHDIHVAAQGITVTHIPTVEGYLENYLLAGRFELHSIVADLWSNLGAVGIALGLVAGALIATGLAVQLSRGQASGLVCYLAPLTLWSLAFGPLPTGLPKVALALGLLLAPAVARIGPPGRDLDPADDRSTAAVAP
jgi:capsular polysaccharide biosynthesis protein